MAGFPIYYKQGHRLLSSLLLEISFKHFKV